MTDRDVRKAVRTIEQVGFQGLSIEELERFYRQAGLQILFQRHNLKIGDRVNIYGPEEDKENLKFWFQGVVSNLNSNLAMNRDILVKIDTKIQRTKTGVKVKLRKFSQYYSLEEMQRTNG